MLYGLWMCNFSKAATGVRFTKDPVFIRIPHFYQDDMLFNIALFHELVHIVDAQLNLFYDVKENIKNDVGLDMDKRIIREYFPILNATHSYKRGNTDFIYQRVYS